MQCEKCSFGDPVGEAHYHIVVEKGKVIEVWYMSANGYWDRDLEPDEFFVEYRDDAQQTRPGRKRTAGRTSHAGRHVTADWLKPKRYKSSANFDADAEDRS